MNLDRFLSERSGDWAELEGLVRRAGPTGNRLRPADLERLGTLYRSAAADLALARRSHPHAAGTERLQALVAEAYGVVYSRARRDQTPREFFSRGLWVAVWRNIAMVGLAAAIMGGFTALGALWALNDPSAASGILPSGFVAHGPSFHGGFYGISITARGGLAVTIFVNNIEVAFLAIVGGFTFGLLTAFSLAYNGALLGVVGALEWRAGGFDAFVRLVVPHGLLELSCISLAGGAGFAIARALIDPGRGTRAAALSAQVPVIGACTLGTVVFLIMAGLTEGFITPWDLALWPALGVGVLLAGSFWAAVVLRGATAPPAQPPASLAARVVSLPRTPSAR